MRATLQRRLDEYERAERRELAPIEEIMVREQGLAA
jgi:hypothetical protein